MGWRNRRTWDEPPEEEIQEECSCGKCRWDTFDPYDNPRCQECATGPLTSGIHRVRRHVARKTYMAGFPEVEIRPGDTYRRTVSRDFYPDGPWTGWTTRLKRLEKGWAWAEAHTVEPKPEGWDEQQAWNGWPLASCGGEG